MDYFLEVLAGPESGNTIPFSGSNLLIGRDPGQCSLVLNDQKVSRVHAQINRYEGDLFYLEDLGSTHGTLLNGNPVPEASLLSSEDRITVGDSVIEFKSGNAASGLALGDPRGSTERKKTLFRKELVLPLVLLVVLTGAAFLLIMTGLGGESRRADPLALAGEEAYLRFRSESHSNLVASFSSFESLVSNPLHTPAWERSLKVSMATIMVLCEEIQEVTAPEKYKFSHDYLTAAANDYYRAMEYFMARNPEYARHHLASGDANYNKALLSLASGSP